MSAHPSTVPSSESRDSGPEQRRHYRVDVLGQIEAHSVWKLQPLSLRELSLSGFSIETTSPFEVGLLAKFRLGIDGHARSIVVQARARHCSLKSATTGLAIYVVGFEIVSPSESTLRELVALIDFAQALWAQDQPIE
jgi:hypothetical protein